MSEELNFEEINLVANTPYTNTIDLTNTEAFSISLQSTSPMQMSIEDIISSFGSAQKNKNKEPFQITTIITDYLGKKTTQMTNATDFNFQITDRIEIQKFKSFQYILLSTKNIKVNMYKSLTYKPNNPPSNNPPSNNPPSNNPPSNNPPSNNPPPVESKPESKPELSTTRQAQTSNTSGIVIGILSTLLVLGIIGFMIYYYKNKSPTQQQPQMPYPKI